MKSVKVHSSLFYIILLVGFIVLFSCKKKTNNSSKAEISNIYQKQTPLQEVKVSELTKEQIASFFTQSNKEKLEIKFDIRKVYKVVDSNGETLFIVSEKFLGRDNEDNRIITDIELIIASSVNGKYIVKDRISDKINTNEKSIWFWTKFLKLEDFNNDGYVDPIIIHGGLNSESRLIVNVFNRDEKYQIIHRASDQDIGRYTKFDKDFIQLDKPIRTEVIKLLRVINEKYLAMNSETLELMNSFE